MIRQREQILKMQNNASGSQDKIELEGIQKVKELAPEDKYKVLEFLVKEMMDVREQHPGISRKREESADSLSREETKPLKKEKRASKKPEIIEETISDQILTERDLKSESISQSQVKKQVAVAPGTATVKAKKASIAGVVESKKVAKSVKKVDKTPQVNPVINKKSQESINDMGDSYYGNDEFESMTMSKGAAGLGQMTAAAKQMAAKVKKEQKPA